MKQLLTILLAAFVLSCENKETTDDFNSFISVDLADYNNRISEWATKGEPRAADPICITRELFRNDDPERKTTIDFQSEVIDKAIVTLTQEGLSDDSVKGEKRIIDFERVDQIWTIKKIKLGVKCWKDRGHTHYSGRPCS